MTSFSIKGWRFKEWLLGNGKTIKEVIKLGVPVLIGWMITKNPAGTTLISILGKLIIDTAEFYIKE